MTPPEVMMSLAWYEQSGATPLTTLTHPPSPGSDLRPAADAHRSWWADRPKVIKIHDEDVEVHYVGDFAMALGVSPVTVRRWEGLGLLPRTPLRAQHRGLPHTRRLYTNVMVEQAARLAKVYEIGPFHRPTDAFRNDLQFCWERAVQALHLSSTVLCL